MKSNIVTRVAYGNAYQIAATFGITHQPVANTTLNEALGISPNVQLNPGETPVTRYFAIGSGGVTVAAGSDGTPGIVPYDFRPRWSGLLKQRPFVLRPEDNDLTAEERKKYFLRSVEVHNDQRYFAYRLKEFDITGVEIEQYTVLVRDGKETYIPLVPTNEDLHPEPVEVAPDLELPTLANGDYILTRYVVTIPFTPADVEEFVNAVRITDNDTTQAVISELAIVGAVKRNIQVEGPGGSPMAFEEACCATLYEHVATYENFNFTNNGTEFTVEAGIIEPMTTSTTV